MGREDTVVASKEQVERPRVTARGAAVAPPPPVPARRPTPRHPLPAAIPTAPLTLVTSQYEAFPNDTERKARSTRTEVGAASPPPATAAAVQGKILVFFGCRGGAGATTLSVNAASSLVRTGSSVCLLDLDLQLGDVFVALDLEANTSISALAREAGLIDGAALRRRLQRHDSGIYALSQTGRLDDVDPELADRMPALLASLCDHFDYVLVDGVRDFSDHALAVLDMADKIALVVTQDVPAIRRAGRVTHLFRKLGYSEHKIQLVVNRHLPKAALDETEIERALGLPIAGRVRNDYARMRMAMDDGALLHDVARNSGIAEDVDLLGRVLSSDDSVRAAHDDVRSGLLSRFFAGRK